MQINNFSFDVNGLRVQFDNSNFLELCPKATCALLEDLNEIESWQLDSNGEPVILISDETAPRGYDFELWCDFVKVFYLNKQMVSVLVARLQDLKSQKRTQAMIAYLTNTLQVA